MGPGQADVPAVREVAHQSLANAGLYRGAADDRRPSCRTAETLDHGLDVTGVGLERAGSLRRVGSEVPEFSRLVPTARERISSELGWRNGGRRRAIRATGPARRGVAPRALVADFGRADGMARAEVAGADEGGPHAPFWRLPSSATVACSNRQASLSMSATLRDGRQPKACCAAPTAATSRATSPGRRRVTT